MGRVNIPRGSHLLSIGAILCAAAVDLIGAETDQLSPCRSLGNPQRNLNIGKVGSFRVRLAHPDIGNCRRVNDRIRTAFLNDSLDVFLRGIPKRWRGRGTLHRLHQSMAYKPIRAGY